MKFNYATKLKASGPDLDFRKGKSKTNGRCRYIRNILLFHLTGKFLACQFSISAEGLSLTEIFLSENTENRFLHIQKYPCLH